MTALTATTIVGTAGPNGDSVTDIAWDNPETGGTQIWFTNRRRVTERPRVLGEDGQSALIGLSFSTVCAVPTLHSCLGGLKRAHILAGRPNTAERYAWRGRRVLSVQLDDTLSLAAGARVTKPSGG